MRTAVAYMPFQITVRAEPAPARVIVTGELDRATGPQLNAVMRDLVTAPGHVVLDLSAVSFIDAGGVAVIWAASRRAERHGCTLDVRLDEHVARTFRRVGLDRHLPVARD